jgi:hypothetical protein
MNDDIYMYICICLVVGENVKSEGKKVLMLLWVIRNLHSPPHVV